MQSVRYGMLVVILSACFLGLAHAQADENQLPPTDYGAGYEIVMVSQHEEHPPFMPKDPADANAFGPVKLDLSYPLIASPLTPDAKEYNTVITQLISEWWKDIGGPKDNSPMSDPSEDISLDCEPVGLLPPVEFHPPAAARMLPDVISMTCAGHLIALGGAHGGTVEWGFNWLLSKRRPITPNDFFVQNSGWLKALTAIANAERKGAAPWAEKLDYADRHHWVLRTDGLGFAYSVAEFTGYEEGGMGAFDLIPWPKLAPYLRKDGIVPQKYWSNNAKLPVEYLEGSR